LSLSKIQQGHDGTFFVLRRVLLQDFFHTLLVVRIEFKLELGVVFGCVAVLCRVTSMVECPVYIKKDTWLAVWSLRERVWVSCLEAHLPQTKHQTWQQEKNG
jgi:Zn-dependent protease